MSSRLVVVSGPSGVGKTTVCNHLLERADFERVITATTRAPRGAEKHGEDYLFLTEEEFDRWIDQGAFLEWARVHGHRYGSPRERAERIVAAGRHALLNIDVQGAAAIPGAFRVFLLPPTMEALERRLRGRGTNSPGEIAQRMETAREELEHQDEFNLRVVNDDSRRAAEEIAAALR